jgi:hypothetical protein
MAGVYGPRPIVSMMPLGGVPTGMSDNVWDQATRTLREFGLEPKGRGRTYQKPYPKFFDIVPYP